MLDLTQSLNYGLYYQAVVGSRPSISFLRRLKRSKHCEKRAA